MKETFCYCQGKDQYCKLKNWSPLFWFPGPKISKYLTPVTKMFEIFYPPYKIVETLFPCVQIFRLK